MLDTNAVMLIGRRQLRDVGAIAAPEGTLSFVAVPTYKAAEDNSPVVAGQVLDTPGGGQRDVVIVDSVQSQANRVEQRLRELFEELRPDLLYPRIHIDFPDGGPRLTSFDLCHRSADQSLRLTDYYDGATHRTLNIRPAFAPPHSDLTYFVEHFPIDVLFGTWHSHKGPTIKLPRLLNSTIIGYGPLIQARDHRNLTNRTQRGSQKNDPLISGSAKVITDKQGNIVDIDPLAKATEDERLSKHGLGDIVGGVGPSNVFAFEIVEQRVSLALAPLHRSHFPRAGGEIDHNRDVAGRRMLLALALLSFRFALECDGYLRSGCTLVPVPGTVEIYSVNRLGEETIIPLPTVDELVAEYEVAVQAAAAAGFVIENVDATPNQAFIKAYETNGKGVNHKEPDAEEGAAK